jgi:hypothetical protein
MKMPAMKAAEVDEAKLLKGLAAASGPNNQQGQSLPNSNPHWSNAGGSWSYEFPPRATKAIAAAINTAITETTPGIEGFSKQLSPALKKHAIFDAAGLKKPDISILSDEFLAEVKHLPQRNLAVELLQKLLNNELKIRSKKYLVQSRSFAEMLEATIRRYQNRTIEAAQVIAELIELAKQMREGQKRGDKLGLTDDEVAFYDALEVNDSAVKVLGEPTLKDIARELVAHVRKSVTIDWTLRESAQAQIRVLVRRILRKYGYPPDKQEKATQTVLEQAKLLCGDWAEGV